MLTPSPQLVDAYLGEIAKGYNIAWSPPNPQDDTSGGGGDDDDEGGVKVSGPSRESDTSNAPKLTRVRSSGAV